MVWFSFASEPYRRFYQGMFLPSALPLLFLVLPLVLLMLWLLLPLVAVMEFFLFSLGFLPLLLPLP
jgi:hypothetical protein